MNAHSPAPWFAKPAGHYRMAITSADESTLIASVLINEPANPDPESSRWSDTIPLPHGAANAALILAAPELLEALVLAIEAMRRNPPRNLLEQDALEHARSVVSKATRSTS